MIHNFFRNCSNSSVKNVVQKLTQGFHFLFKGFVQNIQYSIPVKA